MNLGAHMSISGGLHRALERGRSIDCRVVQIFTKNQVRWQSPPLRQEDVERFLKLQPLFTSVFAHGSYLINLASPREDLYRRSIDNLVEELLRCQRLNLKMLVLHPGAHMGTGLKVGIARIARGIREAYLRSEAREVRILLETTSGQGTAVGGRFEHLRDILDELTREEPRCGVCLDSCHIFSAGYDLRTDEAYARTWEEFEARIGIESLEAIHLNDSKRELGSGVDLHEHIGRGKIGLSGFRLLLNDPRLEVVPMCLETPKGNDLKEDVENLATLRRLRQVPGRG